MRGAVVVPPALGAVVLGWQYLLLLLRLLLLRLLLLLLLLLLLARVIGFSARGAPESVLKRPVLHELQAAREEGVVPADADELDDVGVAEVQHCCLESGSSPAALPSLGPAPPQAPSALSNVKAVLVIFTTEAENSAPPPLPEELHAWLSVIKISFIVTI